MDFKALLAQELQQQFELTEITKNLIEVPPDDKLGDFSLPCFSLAKQLRKSPSIIAKEIGDKICIPKYIEKVQAIDGYVNFHLKKEIYADWVIGELLEKEYFKKKDETVIVEYSSPNIAKPFHIGHLCSTVIGDSLARIYKFVGYNVVRINYLGDYGTQFGKLIAAFKRWGDYKALQMSQSQNCSVYMLSFTMKQSMTQSLKVKLEYILRTLKKVIAKKLKYGNCLKKSV
jgi:arginyl-tRNA synthetase